MPQTREDIRAERKRLIAEYRELFDSTADLLFRHDPIGINFTTNTDEYEPEVGTVCPRLRACHSEADVCQVLHEEFVRWFGTDTAGPLDHYQPIAAELWTLYRSSTAANNALQRTEAGGRLSLASHVRLRKPLSLSLEALGRVRAL